MDKFTDFLDSNSLCNRVYEFLRGQILSGKLPPNTKLPETELAASMNVSRAPIREALNILVSDGFVVKIPRHGAVVAPVTHKEIYENWDLRMLIEPHAAKAACHHIPKEELLSVRQIIIDTMDTDSLEIYMDSDYRTHSTIYEYVPNSQLQNFLRQTMSNSMRYRFYAENHHSTYSSVANSSVTKAVCEEHLAIVDALLEEDGNKAYNCMAEHINCGYKRLVEQFRGINSDETDHPSIAKEVSC